MQVIAQQAHAFQTLLLLIGQKGNVTRVNKQAALDPPSARLLHATPVLERLGHQAPGRNRDNGLVEILYFDRVQGDIDDITIGTDLRHLDPVADPQQIVAGQLHTGHERQQGILVDQQDDRRHRSQTRKQQHRRAIDQGGDDDDGREHIQQHFRQLDVTLDRSGLGVIGARVDIEQGVQQRADDPRQHENGNGQRQVTEEMATVVAHIRHQVAPELHHQRGRQLRQAMEYFVFA